MRKAYLGPSNAYIGLADGDHLFHSHDASFLLLDRGKLGQGIIDDFAKPRGKTEGVLLEISANKVAFLRSGLLIDQKHAGHEAKGASYLLQELAF